MPPIFREEMICRWKVHRKQQYLWNIPTGSGEYKPAKPDKKGVRWNKTFGRHDKGSIGEAGTPIALAWSGCQTSE